MYQFDTDGMDWRLTNCDADYENWRCCGKCRRPYRKPKTLTCLHTICFECLDFYMHLAIERHKHETGEDRVPDKITFPCPICSFPFHTVRDGLHSLPTNHRVLRLSYKERALWWEERAIMDKQSPKPGSLEKRLISPGKKPKAYAALDNSERQDLAKETPASENVDTGKDVKVEVVTANPTSPEKSDGGPGLERFHEGGAAEFVPGQAIKTEGEESEHSGVWETMYPAMMVDEVKQHLESHRQHTEVESWDAIVKITAEEDTSLPGSRSAQWLYTFNLRHGALAGQCLNASAFAVNKTSGNVVVVDGSLCKAVLYNRNGTLYSEKNLNHPVVDCAFMDPSDKYTFERFTAVGLKSEGTAAVLISSPFDTSPNVQVIDQKNISDVTGFLISGNDRVVSIGKENTVIRRMESNKFKPIFDDTNAGLRYPTRMAQRFNGDIVLSDTGNHRMMIFYGEKQRYRRHFGSFGSGYGEFFYPLGLAVDRSDRIFVCDTCNYRVQVFDERNRFESIPIKRTFNMAPSVSQDVKPIDCALDPKGLLLVLFRGRGYVSLKVFNYSEPLLVHSPYTEEIVEITDPSPCCLKYYLCCCCCCRGGRDSRRKFEYEPI